MSAPVDNVELIRRGYQAYARRDFAAYIDTPAMLSALAGA